MSDVDLTNYDSLAERTVLAACMTSTVARAEALRTLIGPDFWDTRHEAIWDAMSRLERHGKPVEPVTLLHTLGPASDAGRLMPDLITLPVVPENVGHYAAIVRSWGIKRRLFREATTVVQQALKPDLNAVGYAASVATAFANLRDAGMPDVTTAETLAELLSGEDDEPDWLIPGLLERRDRLMLTGEEGLGKSHLLRQIAVMSAAGLDPFEIHRIKPLAVTIIDCENSRSQVRRKIRPIVETVHRLGGQNPTDRVVIDCTPRMDITRDKDLARIHQLLDATQPDLVVIGPLYRLVPRALQTDDEAAPVLAALDTIRDRDIALCIEAHAGHAIGKGGNRDLRPRGSSALLGWPEFGYGLRALSASFCDVVPWRGDRDERNWPERLRREHNGPRWIPTEAFDIEESA